MLIKYLVRKTRLQAYNRRGNGEVQAKKKQKLLTEQFYIFMHNQHEIKHFVSSLSTNISRSLP